MATEREICEQIADGWMTDMKARTKLASVIETARQQARVQTLDEAANLVEELRPSGGPWQALESAAKAIRALKAKVKP